MSAPRREPWSGESEVERLYERVREACAAEADLPGRLAAALRAALDLLAADPELAYRLTVDPALGLEPEAPRAALRWVARFGDLLSGAAAEDPRASREPAFLAGFLVGGVRFQIAGLVLAGEAADLPRLLPGVLEALLAYYLEPGEAPGLAAAALAA